MVAASVTDSRIQLHEMEENRNKESPVSIEGDFKNEKLLEEQKILL
jgi:hypothetical protein